MRLRTLLCGIAGCICLAAQLAAYAQAYPAKPIRILVPYGPGGGIDIIPRTVAPKMTDELGQPVIVENRPGAGGRLGAQFVARSAPDGYTIMITIGGAHILSMFTSRNLPYHPVKDFTPITAAVDTVLVIAASASFPANSMQELIEYAKRNPGTLSYGTTGVGGITHLAMEQIALVSGTRMVHVPYKGGTALTTNLVGGQLPVGVTSLASVIQYVQPGKIKALAFLTSKRYRAMPDVPTVVEAVPGFENMEGGSWVYGPAGLSQPIVQRLNASFVKALNAPDVREKLEAGGMVVVGNTPEEFAALIQKTAQLSERLVKAAGIQPE